MSLDTGELLRLGKRLFKEVGDDDLSGLAAEFAYRAFLALFPFFIFLAALGGFIAQASGVQNPTDEVMKWLGDALPADASSVLRTQLQKVIGEKNPALLSLGILGAVWAASSALNTVMKGMNRTYEVRETRPIWRRYALSVGLTVMAGSFTVTAFVLLIVGQIYGRQIGDSLGMGNTYSLLFSLARWPAALALLLVAMAFLYWAAPNARLPFRWISPGAVMFTAVWLAASFLFGLYVANFGSYGATYGTLGGVVVLLVWLYITGFILMLGAEINAVLVQEEAPQELPQTAVQGATPETVPDGREEEADARARGRQPKAVAQRTPRHREGDRDGERI